MSGRISRVASSAMPSAWPATICPPSSSPTFNARSRLSRVPIFQQPAVVMRKVSAAASLKSAFTAYAAGFDAAHVRLSFGGSDVLAAQIRQGARFDVYAAANAKLPAPRSDLVVIPYRE